MIELVVFSVTIFGIAWGVGLSSLSHPFRSRLPTFFVTMLECLGCQSFHWGWIAYLLHLTPAALTSWWVAAFYSAASSLILLRFSGLGP